MATKATTGFEYFQPDGTPSDVVSSKVTTGVDYFFADGTPLSWIVGTPAAGGSVQFSWWAWNQFGCPLSPEG